ncbi:unnamed protein product [Linum tenue]|uniref:Protein SPIRAL1-like 1 n=1 Tax=Linum tenue TaxID=586396 RepID=A0AAV0NXS6_9ROSI|nr:unnamed protein product [Linum tenue]
MGRGVSSGGGQSSLGYLFGSGESPKPAKASSPPTAAPVETETVHADITKQIPAGINSTSSNNYMRADGQNTGNFLTVKIIPQITTALCSFLSDMVECS